jgi:capsid protein
MSLLSTVRKWPARWRARNERAAARRQPGRGPRGLPASRLQYTPLGLTRTPVCALSSVSETYDEFATTRSRGRSIRGDGSADAVLRYELDDLRDRSRYLDLYNPIYQAMIDRVCDVILGGSGLTLQARTGNPAVNARLESLWRLHRRRPEIRGLDDHVGHQRLLLRHLFVDGDVGEIKDRATGTVQIIEADRIASHSTRAENQRRIERGIELDGPGRPQAFYIAPYDDFGLVRSGQAARVEAENFIFLAHRRRSSQTRGVPVQQANFAMFDRIEDICDSEAIAWQLLSRIAVAIEKEQAGNLEQATSVLKANRQGDEIAQRIQEIGSGLIFWGRPGESVKGIDHNIPGRNFGESLKMFMRLLGLPFGFSLEFTLLIWSDTNYSSGRASKLQVERSCKPWCNQLADALTNEYAWQIQRWVNARQIVKRGDLFEHTWFAEPYPFLDPVKEEQARVLRFECGTTSASIEAKAVGHELEDLAVTQEQDADLLALAAERHNVRHPTQPVVARRGGLTFVADLAKQWTANGADEKTEEDETQKRKERDVEEEEEEETAEARA